MPYMRKEILCVNEMHGNSSCINKDNNFEKGYMKKEQKCRLKKKKTCRKKYIQMYTACEESIFFI